jgi:hypothetical protein
VRRWLRSAAVFSANERGITATGSESAKATLPIFRISSPDSLRAPTEDDMDTTTLLIIIVVLLLLGGGWYGRGRWY